VFTVQKALPLLNHGGSIILNSSNTNAKGGVAGHPGVDAHVDPEHRAQWQVLVGPRHQRVLRRHLERLAGDRQPLGHRGAHVGINPE
jgi:hypothetical protein